MFDSLDDLRTYVRVIETGSLSAAARSLRVSVNAVWRRVGRLEERAGTRLVERTTRALRVTEVGARLAKRARVILDELELAEREVTASVGRLRGVVRVALSPDLARAPLLADLGRLLVDNPALRVEIVGRAVQKDPVTADVDVVVWAGPVASQSSTMRRVCSLAWALAAAPSYVARRGVPVRPEALIEHDCLLVLRPTRETIWTLLDPEGRSVDAPVRGQFESDSAAFLRAALFGGLGIGQWLLGDLTEDVAAGRLVPVLPGYGLRPLEVSLVTPQGGGSRAPAVRAVTEVIAGELRRLAGRA